MLEALRLAPAPAAIPESCFSWVQDDAGRHAVVTDVQEWVRLAAERGQTFTELGAPWTSSRGDDRRRPSAPTASDLRIGDRPVATYDRGFGVTPTSSPRPFLHPVRTLGGFVVTDAHPSDHDWHLGIGVAVQDVDGWNLWGGRTYVRDQGYQWLGDHGRMDHVGWLRHEPGLADEELRWVDGRGRTLLHERREIRWSAVDPAATGIASGWLLEFAFTLTAPGTDPVAAGQPRDERPRRRRLRRILLAAAPHRLDRDPDAGCCRRGAGARQHRGLAGGHPAERHRDADGTDQATIVLSAADPDTAARSLVRPQLQLPRRRIIAGLGQPVPVNPGQPLRRGFRAVIADGAVDPATVAALLPQLGSAH